MPYWLKFTLYLLAANVVVLTLAHLLTKYGAVVNAIFAVIAAVVGITLGRKLLKRERL
jgi:hypothetical protein